MASDVTREYLEARFNEQASHVDARFNGFLRDFEAQRREQNKDMQTLLSEIRDQNHKSNERMSTFESDMKGSIGAVESSLKGEIMSVKAELSGEISRGDAGLKDEVVVVRSELSDAIGRVDSDLKVKIAETKSGLLWGFAAISIAAIGVVPTVVAYIKGLL